MITYEGIHRVEQYMFHKDAFREIVLNAIVHKDYASCNPIQISVYPDKIYIWNDGTFPEDLNTATKLYRKHSSKPFNPKLAGAFFKCGLIEAWGRGFDKIVEGCREYAGPRPTYKISATGVMVLCKACPAYEKLQSEQTGDSLPMENNVEETSMKTGLKTGMETSMKTSMKTSDAILVLLRENSELSIDGLAAKLNRARSSIIEQVAKLKQAGKLRRIGPDKGGHWEIMA